jgi:hypothetical protein
MANPMLRTDIRGQLFPAEQRREEFVGYYAKPQVWVTGKGQTTPNRYAGWITTMDTQSNKFINYIRRGFVPLPQFGRVTDSFELWTPMLSHRDGPAAFPKEQVIIYRWYNADNLPGSMKGRDLYFPQLVGVEIEEYDCPECNMVSFFEPFELARHLRNHHDYDRAELLALGSALGIDFSKTILRIIKPMRKTVVEARDPAAVTAPTDEATHPRVAVNRVRPPSTKGATMADLGLSESDESGGESSSDE